MLSQTSPRLSNPGVDSTNATRIKRKQQTKEQYLWYFIKIKKWKRIRKIHRKSKEFVPENKYFPIRNFFIPWDLTKFLPWTTVQHSYVKFRSEFGFFPTRKIHFSDLGILNLFFPVL